MATPPTRNEIAGTPTNAEAKAGFGKLWDYLTGLLGMTGNVAEAQAALFASGMGYQAGSGGTVTQATSKSTAVTLNKPSGQITMNNAALASGAIVQFNVTNSLASIGDVLVLTLGSGSFTNYAYNLWANIQTAGGFTISVKNIDSVSRSEAVVINYTIVKGASS
jgi:hypothetical protein